jgi:hypothetical protein
MSARRKPARAVTSALAVTVALAAGCGGSDDGDSDGGRVASIESVPTTPGAGLPAEESRRGGAGAGKGGADQRDPRPPGSSRGGPGGVPAPGLPGSPGTGASTQFQRRVAGVIRRLPRKKRDAHVRSTTRAVFAGFGFNRVNVVLTSDGEGVRATVGRDQACRARAQTESNLAKAMRAVIPWLGSTHVAVTPGGQRLARYVQSQCRAPSLPGGTGPVVYTGQGIWRGTTRRFRVRSRRWTVEYLNGGHTLHMIVLRNGRPSNASLDSGRRGPGRRTFSGPGTFSLQIASSGEWLVRVRDGG